jgi:alanine racemase
VGVPLSIFAINEKHNLGVFAGISTVNEMVNWKGHSAYHWILTSIGSSHDEGFLDLEEKIKEKLILLKMLRF